MYSPGSDIVIEAVCSPVFHEYSKLGLAIVSPIVAEEPFSQMKIVSSIPRTGTAIPFNSKSCEASKQFGFSNESVSYTHLTLPTICSV